MDNVMGTIWSHYFELFPLEWQINARANVIKFLQSNVVLGGLQTKSVNGYNAAILSLRRRCNDCFPVDCSDDRLGNGSKMVF